MATRKKVGVISFQRPDMKVKKKWKSYRFEINANYFFYCKADNVHQPDGMIVLARITKLETNAVKEATYPLQVHFKGKPQAGNSSSPWVLDLTSNEERMVWMECLVPGSSKDLQRFSRPGTLRQIVSPVHPHQPPIDMGASEYDSPSSLKSNGSFHGFNSPTTPQDYMEFMPNMSCQVGSYSESSCHITTPSKQPYSVGSASAESRDSLRSSTGTRPRGQSTDAANYPREQGNSSGLDPSLASVDPTSSLPIISARRRDPHRHTFGHGGSPRESIEKMPRSNTERIPRSSNESRPQPAARTSKSPRKQSTNTQRKLPQEPWMESLVCSKDEMEASVSPVHHLYEMDDMDDMNEYLTNLDDILLPGESSGKKKPPTQGSRVPGNTSMEKSSEKEGEYDVPVVKEGEYDCPRNPPVPATRHGRASTKPVVAPRRKKEPVIEHEYLDLMPGGDSEQDRKENYVRELSSLGLNPQVVSNFSVDQLNKLRAMLQEGQQQAVALSSPGMSNMLGNGSVRQYKQPMDYVDSFPTDKILVTDEDNEDSYLPRPNWAKAIGLDAARKRPQLSSDCEALSDLQEEALYIPRSSVNDFHEIGEGQFGMVFRATLRRGMGKTFTVAVKTAKKSTSEKERSEFLREMNIMAQMRHPNIVQLHGIIRDDVPAPWIVLEFLKYGDLKHFLIKNTRPVETLVRYMIDVAMGMHYLSEKGLVHRDLAARNVLINEEETCKVSDFGLLRELPKDDSIYHMSTAVPCPVRWMSPESIEERNFSPASDVWSFGILQWEMFNPKCIPYPNFGNMEVVMKVMKGYRLETHPDCPSVVSRIMKACWHHIPEKRPSFLLITTLLSKV